MPLLDLNRIERHILRENYLMLLGFPTKDNKGYIPLRVMGRELFYYEYDPRQEAQITTKVPPGAGINGINDLGFITPTRLSSQYLTGKPYNVFYVKDYDQVLQLFYGIAPSALRVYLEAPASVGQKNLDIDRWANNKLQFGYIDGFDSPLLNPSPQSELIIPPELDFAIGYGNPLPVMMDPLIQFVVNRLQVAIVSDPTLVEKMLDGRAPAAIKTIGGLASFTYSTKKVYGIDTIPLDASLQEIATTLGVTLPTVRRS